MAFPLTGTKLANLVNPQVIADFFDAKLVDAIKFAPLCSVDYTLEGRPGNTVTVPVYHYIGDASTVAEGGDIGIAQLTTGTDTATIHKVGQGVQISDEAVLSGLGDPVAESVSQLNLSIASGIETEILTTMGGATLKQAKGSNGFAEDVSDALELFGEDIEGAKVLLVAPAQYTELRKSAGWLPASEISAEIVVKGAVGEIAGCQVVVSNRLKNKNLAYIVKPGAVKLFIKRDTLVETDRDIINKSTVITADKHFTTYLYDESKIIEIAC